jgi:hypothetical protein
MTAYFCARYENQKRPAWGMGAGGVGNYSVTAGQLLRNRPRRIFLKRKRGVDIPAVRRMAYGGLFMGRNIFEIIV